MSKQLTTRERNEIIGLAVDYDSDSYNHILDFLYDRNFCNGNKSDCRILAAIIAVSKIDDIETVEKYNIVVFILTSTAEMTPTLSEIIFFAK